MDSEIPTDARLLQRYQQQSAERTACNASTQEPPLYREATVFQKAWKSVSLNAAEEVRSLPDFVVPEEMRSNILQCLSEHRRGRHDEALTSMYHELACITREMEPFVLEPGKFLLTKLMESDRKIELLFKKIEFDTTLGGFSIEGLEELWSIIHQESLTRRKWIKEMDESLKKVERSRADQITAVLRKYTVILENISFFLSADVYRLMNDEAMLINRALLANQRAIAKLFFNLIKSELKKELFHRLKWQDRVKDWKLIQKNCIVHSFREFMANEEIQNPPSVKAEMENMITDQILLSERRLEFLQHLGDLLPPTHTKAEISEWYRSLVNLNTSIDTYNVQCMRKIRIRYERVQQTCLAAMQRHKNNLLTLNICTKEEAEEIVNSDFLWLTEKLENHFEEELQHMDRDFEELAKQHDQNCKDLYSYFQEAMGLWDVHQLKLSQREDELQKKLDECRREHDNLTQNLQGKTDSTLQDQELVKVPEAECLVEQQAESSVQENEGEEKMNSCQQENEETNIAENEEIFAQETEKKEENEDEESIPHESEETEHAEQGVMFNSSKAESSEIAIETFSTCSGNSYTVLGVEEAGKTGIPETYFTKYEQKESLPVYLKYVLIKEKVFVELKKRIRLCFFEHLEKWFAESLSNSYVFVAAKKEELNSELQLRLHLHQQKQENIETNIYSVRAVELLLHKERLECHCTGVGEALEKERAEFLRFCEQQDNICKNLESRLRDMESVFLSAPMTEKLVSFSNNLHSELHNHLEMIQVSLRSYRNYLEEAFGKLRDSNVDFLKACRLFLEGGNFSPEEVKSFSKRLQEESERIDAFEGLIKTDMEKMESSCLEQATELIHQSETKFRYLFMNRVFMEKIQQFLTNLRVQIKSEVANSNLQAVTLNSYLEKLRQKIDACAHPTAYAKHLFQALTSEELYDFAKVALKELKKRSQYLDCLLVKAMSLHENEDFAPLATDVTLQDPVAVGTRTECLGDDNKVMVMGLDPVKFPLLNPSRMGKSAVDDLAISVIKNLLEIQPHRKTSGLNQDHSSGAAILPTSKKSSCFNVSDEDPRKSACCSSAALTTRKTSTRKPMRTGRIQKYTRPVLSGKEFQIFEEKPPESDTFKGIIMNILWMGNNSLLCLAEEFYQKEKPQVTKITIPEDLPETFEHCAEVLRQNLLSYQSQTDDYYNSCLIEFQDQLKLFEKELSYVSLLAVESLFKEHEQKLSYSTGQIRLLFNKRLEDWENLKAAHKNQLRPSLGHPDNLLQLDALHQKELKRQKEQADGIHLNMQMLQDCAAECAQNFVSALAAFTEKLLLELDESVTTDDVQVPKIEIPREKTSSRKQAGLPLEICEVKQITERGSRTWPGIPMTTLADNADYVLCRETASVTTAKTTLGHVAAVEARNAVYEKYKRKLEQQFAQIKEESTAQLQAIQHEEEWWKKSIQKIKQLYR
ncbi:coiled-coil domain-containing protein 180 isoform X8 [Strigops habroptila]|uniref:coiled-coil domain-containing protein 180 isoform X8 n=1 Tax=Strigops habroptila TaxID=2489341 RepID=UPI0011D019C8|nr:coiled-coil domain-containing protein 180 isoform X8 [Strigops habroptila]